MLDPFVNDIQWSSDKFPLQNVVELFSLPQVVKCHHNAATDSKRSSCFNDDELLVLNAVRNSKVVRATDSLKNEYYIPLWSSARVEVVWREYKTFYDDIEELFEDFPAYVAAEEEDKQLGIKKGDVLKLIMKTQIPAKECSYLQCTLVESPDVEINLPFTYKGVFKTLGSLTQKQVRLCKVTENCSLPLVVKFVDNKLKIKRADGSSRFPIAFFNIDHVTLHEVVDYTDVIASKLLSDATTGTIAISLEIQDFEFYVPVAKTRKSESYKQFCDKFAYSATTEMAKKIGIMHSYWIVFEDQEKTALKQAGKIDQDSEKSTQSTTLTQPRQVHSTSSSSASSKGLTAMEMNVTQRRSSQSFPRALKPIQAEDMYARINMGTISQKDSQENTSNSESGIFEDEAKYMTMKPNVLSELRKKLRATNVQMIPPKSRSEANYENWDFHIVQQRVAVSSQGSLDTNDKKKLNQRPCLPPPRTDSSLNSEEPPPLPPKPSNIKAANGNEMKLPPGSNKKHSGLFSRSRPSSNRNFFERRINDWSVSDVTKFLEAVGLRKYVKIFSEKNVDGKALIALEESNLVKSFGMTNKKHLETLVKFKEECLKHERFTVENDYVSAP